LRERLESRQGPGDVEWCQAQVVDLLAAWSAAEGDERGHLLGTIFERIEAQGSPKGLLRLVGVPREGWRPYFLNVVAQLHRWSCSNLSEARGRVATLSRAASDVLAS
jgi:hypothetical protein